jgi:hypothetical protein
MDIGMETVLAGGIKSSGEKRDFGTGAHRDSNIKNPKGRMDLIPAVAMSRFANFLCFTRAIIDKEHSLYCYNSAMSSMYAWLEGDRLSGDMPNNVMKGGRPICTFDHLSNVLLNVQDMMHMDDDIPLWYPKTSPDYDLKPPRYDKISPLFLKRVSIHYQLGGINYGNRNWELGMPVMVTWDSACRHLTNWLEHETTEDHLAAIGWNIMCTMHTIEMLNRGVIKDPEGDMHTAPYYYYQDIPAKMYAPKPVRLFDKRDFEFEMGNDDINDFDEDFDEPETARDALRGK